MKIARLTPHFYFSEQNHQSIDTRYDSMGGMQIQLSYLKDLFNKDIHQDIFTLWNPNIASSNLRPNRWTKIIPVNCHLLPFKSRYRGTILLNEFWAFFTILHLLKQREKYDLFHIHCSGVTVMFIMGTFLKKFFKVPIIYTIHCSRNFTYKNMTLLDKLFSSMHKKIEISAIKNSFRTIVLTEEMKTRYLELINDSQKITVIPDCIELDKFQSLSSSPEILFKRYCLDYSRIQEKKIILYVGRIAEEKGWKKMISIAEKISKEYLILICGSGNQIEEMKSLILEKKLSEKVYYTGYIRHSDVGGFMKIADFLIVLSSHEEFGGICLEAFASKLFTIANKVGGLSYNIEDGITGRLVQDNKTDAYVEIIENYSNNFEKEKIIDNAFKKVKLFSKDRVVKQYEEIYHLALL
ncbi:glycosyltransferase [Streptococcus suis]|uniref:glycosyltransferase n=1 Tax=Streptococcus suis TaxID=1307 RepID=UPI001E4D6005|nr:glycosyltransferase [Streptococcus suis]MCB2900118.1 glycosyltransferase [Streptococcus suis]